MGFKVITAVVMNAAIFWGTAYSTVQSSWELNVSEEHITPIFRVENSSSKKPV
jgi:hypothetical protein